MINLIISTHGDMSKAILDLSKMVLGEFDNVGYVTFMPGEGPEDLVKKYLDQIEKFSDTKETLFLVDLFGGSPYNAAARVAFGNNNMDVVTGVNVPMLLELLDAREIVKNVKELAEIAVESGVLGIKSFTDILKNTNDSIDEEDDDLEGL